jgi:mitochondrial chaperone BCS1
LFRWHRKKDGRVYPEPRVEALISCVSYSTAPIKELIEAAKASYLQKRSQKTSIRRPAPRAERRIEGNVWKLVSSRPSRPLDTVVLGNEQKDKIIEDIKEYLHSSTREWYAVRGIPYRRGYVSTFILL